MRQITTHRSIARALIGLVVVFVTFAAGGCRAHPVSMVGMFASDLINDADVDDRRPKLLNQPAMAADRMFGARLETCDDLQRPDVSLITYPVKYDVLKTSRYLVEVANGRIVTLSKTKQNIDGAEDMINTELLKRKFIGNTPPQCRIRGDLAAPLRTLRSREKGQVLRIYDVKNWTNLRGARYCVLRFGSKNLCQSVKLIGVSASTRKDPARR
ncbi:MAG: hypothetical protein QF473_20140 [Planctomycetota bacterium]|jgi:hypothetical protein|nr:hypothetical protein [Planctomycetota bacterium]